MYQILIVDDERAIREGISRLVPWEEMGISKPSLAADGKEALELISAQPPDLVITDIKMPEMDGLELIKRTLALGVEPVFIILTGYGEFEFAQQAMQYGIKHYLLKPCGESDIRVHLRMVLEELRQKREKELFLQQMQDNWHKALPQMKERFMGECIEPGKYNAADFERFRIMFGIPEKCYRLLLIQADYSCDLLERFALRNISEELLGPQRTVMSALIGWQLLMLLNPVKYPEIEMILEEIKKVFRRYYGKELIIAISDETTFSDVPSMYKEALACVQSAFYLGEGSIMTHSDLPSGRVDQEDQFMQDYESISISVRTGHIAALEGQLKKFFARIEASNLRIDMAQMLSMELLLRVVRLGDPDQTQAYARFIQEIQSMGTLRQIKKFVTGLAMDIAQLRYEQTEQKHGFVIETIKKLVIERLSDSDLSLKGLAKEILFMNEDYLGRLFQRQTGERFSQYLLRMRMEKAKELLESGHYKIFEISELTGFGGNNQYFSTVFKKYTGMNPSDYKLLHEHI